MKKQYFLLALLPAVIALVGCATSSTLQNGGRSAIAQESTEGAANTVNIPALTKVLATYVDDQGLVDYDNLQANRQDLDAFNASIQLADPASYELWSEPDQIAFLINAYNSLTLKAIIDESPIKDSIKDIPGVWRFDKHGLLQAEQTLNHIEHDILRANFQEPRIHAALVCAALSCPYLRQEPFTGENLEAQLDDQMKIFLSRPQVLTIDREKNEVKLSEIFDWFGQDWVPGFAPNEGFAGTENQKAVLNFISGYVDAEESAYLKAGGYTISYSTYDWSLNRQP
jgi:hypothetical protein